VLTSAGGSGSSDHWSSVGSGRAATSPARSVKNVLQGNMSTYDEGQHNTRFM
jgi:hypothetical protein